eukprot:Amastigsp_a842949_34.p2 type:complete len:118 gc:universal Amastigsp_a842949_34:646-293(-)
MRNRLQAQSGLESMVTSISHGARVQRRAQRPRSAEPARVAAEHRCHGPELKGCGNDRGDADHAPKDQIVPLSGHEESKRDSCCEMRADLKCRQRHIEHGDSKSKAQKLDDEANDAHR